MSAETLERLRVAIKRFEGGHVKQDVVDAAQKAHDDDEAGAKPAPKPRTRSRANAPATK